MKISNSQANNATGERHDNNGDTSSSSSGVGGGIISTIVGAFFGAGSGSASADEEIRHHDSASASTPAPDQGDGERSEASAYLQEIKFVPPEIPTPCAACASAFGSGDQATGKPPPRKKRKSQNSSNATSEDEDEGRRQFLHCTKDGKVSTFWVSPDSSSGSNSNFSSDPSNKRERASSLPPPSNFDLFSTKNNDSAGSLLRAISIDLGVKTFHLTPRGVEGLTVVDASVEDDLDLERDTTTTTNTTNTTNTTAAAAKQSDSDGDGVLVNASNCKYCSNNKTKIEAGPWGITTVNSGLLALLSVDVTSDSGGRAQNLKFLVRYAFVWSLAVGGKIVSLKVLSAVSIRVPAPSHASSSPAAPVSNWNFGLSASSADGASGTNSWGGIAAYIHWFSASDNDTTTNIDKDVDNDNDIDEEEVNLNFLPIFVPGRSDDGASNGIVRIEEEMKRGVRIDKFFGNSNGGGYQGETKT